MKKLENKGITLIALVVTIIVLIILAGVSISLVLGQDGVVQKAKSGRDNYAEAARLENEQLANVDAFAMNIEAMIPSSPSETPQGTATGTITNMTGGDLEISATVSLSANTNLERTKYVFTTSSNALGTNDESLYKDGTVEQANETVKATKKAGTYYLHVLATDTNGGKTEIVSEQTATSQGKKDFDYTGNVQEITLTPGSYKLEVWGAEGGTGYQYAAGKGGYSYGILELMQSLSTYIYIGGKGNGPTQYAYGGWNGGADSTWTNGTGAYSASGGGGTDIALYGEANSTNWRNDNHLYSRIIVAGGGAGGGYSSNGENYGGGLTSGGSYPAGQTYAGNGGGFGYGGTKGVGTSGYSTPDGSGGGGWYGGGATGTTNTYGLAGGGSGYVYTSSTASNYPSGCLLNSSYYLTDAQTIAGNQQFKAPNGSNETGHSGNGYARITAVD